MPEVGISFGEFHGDVALAVAGAANGYNFTFDFFFRAFVLKLENLPEHDTQFQLDGCAMEAYRVRQGLNGEFLAYFGLAAYAQRHGEHYANSAAALFTAKVNNRHGDSYLVCGRLSAGHSDSRALLTIHRQTDDRVCEQNVEVNR